MVVLVGSAAIQYDSLNAAVLESWDQLKAAFLSRYTNPESFRYKLADDLFHNKQQDQLLTIFVLQCSDWLDKWGPMIKCCINCSVLKGLRTDIRNYLTIKQPQTWKELIQAARIVEMCEPMPSPTDRTVLEKTKRASGKGRSAGCCLSQINAAYIIAETSPRFRSGFTNAGELYSQLTNRLYATAVG